MHKCIIISNEIEEEECENIINEAYKEKNGKELPKKFKRIIGGKLFAKNVNIIKNQTRRKSKRSNGHGEKVTMGIQLWVHTCDSRSSNRIGKFMEISLLNGKKRRIPIFNRIPHFHRNFRITGYDYGNEHRTNDGKRAYSSLRIIKS